MQYHPSQVQITHQNIQGLSSNNFYTLPPPLKGLQKGEYTPKPNWFRSCCSQLFYKIGILKNFAKFTGKHLCCSHFVTKLQVSRLETLLRRYCSTGIFQWILCNFSKNLIYRTPPDNCPCWFLHFNQVFIYWSHFAHFPFIFYLLLLIIAIMRVSREGIKTKIF